MTLRKKTLLIIGLTLVGLMAALYAISSSILLSGFARLEEQDTRRNVERALSALADELSALNNTTRDWAAWDDTYAFIEDANDTYVKSNLATDASFVNNRVNLMLYIQSSGQVVFAKAYDLNAENEIPVPASVQEHIAPGSLLLRHTDTESNVTGIVLLPESPMFIASQPILTSERKGPIRGTLLWGRYLDAAEMERLAETTHLSLTMYRFDDEQMPPDFQEARFSLWEGESLLVRPLSEQLIAGYALLRDIYGKPAFLLRADIPRAIYRQGQASMRYLLLSLLAVGLVFGVTALLLLERLVLSRLARLSTDVSNISASSAFSGRVFMTGKDELSSLAGTINEMLQALEHSQHELRRAYDELEMRVQERTAELSELYDLSRALADAVHDFDTILDLITRRAVETIHITFPKRFAWPAASAIRPPVHCTAPNSSSNWHTPTCKPCSPWPTPWMPKTPTPPITPSDWQPWPWR